MPKSPFSKRFIQVRFVFFDQDPNSEQHLFTIEGLNSRSSYSLCGKTAQEIHQNHDGLTDVTESKDRQSERPVCAKCERKWKAHPASPWKAWGGG